MAGIGLSAIALAFAGLLEQQAGVAIALVEPSDRLAMGADAARLEICAKLGIEPCSLASQEFDLSHASNGYAFSREIAFPDGRVEQGCVVLLPRMGDDHAGTDWFEAQYGLSDRATTTALNTMPDPVLDSLNALSQIASCARRSEVDDQVEAARELAFTALAAELYSPSVEFLAGGGPSASLGATIGSEAAEIGTSVGRRILLEHWKAELGRQIDGRKHCRANLVPAREPVVQVPGAGRPARELLGCLGNPAEWGIPRGTVIDVTDRVLASIASPDEGGDLLERFDRQTTGMPLQADLQPLRDLVFTSSPFPGFQSVEDGLLYSWQVSGQIVGLQ